MTLNSRRHLLSSHWTRATRSNPLLRSPVTTLGHSQRSRVFLTTSRWPRAAAAASVVVHGRKFSPIFYLISSNSLNTLSPDRTHTQIYTYTNNFPWINIKICVHVCVYICNKKLFCQIILQDEREKWKDRENDVKNTTPWSAILENIEMKLDRGSTHHDRRPLHLNYD